MDPTRPGGRLYYYGWNIVLVCVIAQVTALGVAASCFSLFLPGWSKELGAPISVLALGFTGLGVGSAVLAPLAGAAIDRLPVRWLVPAGLLSVALFYAAASQARHAWQLLVLFATLLPLSLAFCTAIPSQAVVARWFGRRRGLALGFTSFGLLMAGAILPPLVVRLTPLIGWRGVWLGAAGVAAVIVAPLCLVVLRDRPGPRHGAEIEAIASPAAGRGAGGVTARQILTRPNFWIVATAIFLLQFMLAGWSVNLAPFALSRGLTPDQTAILLSATALGSLAATLLLGIATDRFGPKIALLIPVVAATAAFGLLLAGSGFGLILAACAPLALGRGAAVPVTQAMAREFGVDAVGRALGFAGLSSAAGLTAPPLVAWLREATGDYQVGLAMLLGAGVLSVLTVLALREPRPQPLAAALEAADVTPSA